MVSDICFKNIFFYLSLDKLVALGAAGSEIGLVALGAVVTTLLGEESSCNTRQVSLEVTALRRMSLCSFGLGGKEIRDGVHGRGLE